MNIIDMDEIPDREEKYRQAKGGRRASPVLKAVLGTLVCLVVLSAGLCSGLALYGKLSGRELADVWMSGVRHDGDAAETETVAEADGVGADSAAEVSSAAADGTGADAAGTDGAAGAAESGGAAGVISDSVVYSQEQLDQKIAEALEAAQNETADKILNGIKEALSIGTTTVETLRPYYPDDIIVVSGGKFYFVPIDRSLKMSRLDAANLQILESGEYQYLTDGQVSSHKGIDVSSHQGKIDWNLVAGDGVEFAMIRLGYRGYGKEGKLVEDSRFEENIQGAKAAGIKVGVYLFSQAVNEEELLEEANLVLEKIAPYEIDCPVVYDVERTSANGRMNQISVEERTRLTLLFCQTIENAGYRPMIYHNTQMSALFIDIAAMESYDKWYASYGDQMFYPYEYKIWQYSDKGTVQGIKTNVDLNISFAPVW